MMPAEFWAHDGTIMIYPTRPGSWGKERSAALSAFAEIFREIARRENLYLLVDAAHMDEAKELIAGLPDIQQSRIHILQIESDDAWARDVGPIFVTNKSHQMVSASEPTERHMPVPGSAPTERTMQVPGRALTERTMPVSGSAPTESSEITASRMSSYNQGQNKIEKHFGDRDEIKQYPKSLRAVKFGFNAWGGEYDGLYKSWERDDKVAATFCNMMGIDYYEALARPQPAADNDSTAINTNAAADNDSTSISTNAAAARSSLKSPDQPETSTLPFILEGGSINCDGEGTVMVTESCLLSRERNPNLTKAEIEENLKTYLGAEKVLWLPRGIYGDETNEHVDNVCSFVGPAEVVLAWTDNTSDPQYELSRADLEFFESATDAKGRRIKVHKLPIPDHPVLVTSKDLANYEFEEGEDQRSEGERLAASYVNFYFINGAALVPQFGGDNSESDARALSILKKLMPDREIIGIDARAILLGGGNIHCITQQIPPGRYA